MNEFDGSPKTWPPLGMPTGSVRALLTLIIVAVVITQLAQGRDFHVEHDLLWVETLLIALAHYFTSRRYVSLPPEVRRQLEDDGVIERERQPLFLPRNSIRLLIVGAFGWLAWYLYVNPPLQEHHAASLLGMMAAFLLGTVVRSVNLWWNRRRPRTSSGTWGDLKALAVLIALVAVAVPEFLGSPEALPPVFHQVALGMTLFYFGSR
jgi:hypothetical protein